MRQLLTLLAALIALTVSALDLTYANLAGEWIVTDMHAQFVDPEMEEIFGDPEDCFTTYVGANMTLTEDGHISSDEYDPETGERYTIHGKYKIKDNITIRIYDLDHDYMAFDYEVAELTETILHLRVYVFYGLYSADIIYTKQNGVTVPEISAPSEITLYDLSGRPVYKGPASGIETSLRHGTFILREGVKSRKIVL